MPFLVISDFDLAVNIGKAYRSYLGQDTPEPTFTLRFFDWFKETYGYPIEWRSGLDAWRIKFPSQSEMVAFKLTHL